MDAAAMKYLLIFCRLPTRMGVTPTLSHLHKKQESDVMVSSGMWTNDSPIAKSRRDWVPRRPAVLVGELTSSWVVMNLLLWHMSIGGSVRPLGVSLLPTMTAKGGFTALHGCVIGAAYVPRSHQIYDTIRVRDQFLMLYS